MKLSAAEKKSYYDELIKNVRKIVAEQLRKGCKFDPNEFFNKVVNSFGFLARGAIKGALLLKENKEKKQLVINALSDDMDIYVEFCKANNEPTEDNINTLADIIVVNTLRVLEMSPFNFQGGRRKGKSKKSSGSKKSVRRGGKKSLKKTSRRRKTQKSKKASRSRSRSRRV